MIDFAPLCARRIILTRCFTETPNSANVKYASVSPGETVARYRSEYLDWIRVNILCTIRKYSIGERGRSLKEICEIIGDTEDKRESYSILMKFR